MLIDGKEWRLVPVEPTLQMMDAADDCVGVWQREESVAAYAAMLAAAPTPPAATAAPSLMEVRHLWDASTEATGGDGLEAMQHFAGLVLSRYGQAPADWVAEADRLISAFVRAELGRNNEARQAAAHAMRQHLLLHPAAQAPAASAEPYGVVVCDKRIPNAMETFIPSRLYREKEWSDADYSKVAVHAAPVAVQAPTDDDAMERALTELVDKIVPGLDTGDVVTDAITASKALDSAQPAASAEPVALSQYGYQTLFNAIAAATWTTADGDIEISVQAFRDALKGAPVAAQAPAAPVRVSDDVRATLLFALWHHQGGSSPVGQPIRTMLGIGQHDHMTKEQYDEAHRVHAALGRSEAPAADGDALDAVFEAVRKAFCKLPRYSFIIGHNGGVRQVRDRSGNWIAFDAAHNLFDPVSVDAAMQRTTDGSAT